MYALKNRVGRDKLDFVCSNQLWNAVFFKTKITCNHFIVHFFLASHCYWSVEPIDKTSKKIFRPRRVLD